MRIVPVDCREQLALTTVTVICFVMLKNQKRFLDVIIINFFKNTMNKLSTRVNNFIVRLQNEYKQ